MDKITKLPQQFQICQTCEELFDDGKYYVSTLDYNKLKSSHEGLVEAAKSWLQHLESHISDLEPGYDEIIALQKLIKAADGEQNELD